MASLPGAAAQECYALLALYEHGSRRMRHSAEGDGDGGERFFAHLLRQRHEWFDTLLAREGIQLGAWNLHRPNKDLRGDAIRMVALMRLSRGVYRQELTALDAQAEVMWSYYGKPKDFCTLNVLHVLPLEQPFNVHTRFREGRGDVQRFHSAGEVCPLTVGTSGIFWAGEDVSSLVLLDNAERVTLSDVIGVATAAPPGPPVLLVNDVIGNFLLAGKWKSLAFLARWWKRPWGWDDWPPAWWRESTVGRAWCPPTADSMGERQTMALLHDLRRWAPKLTEGFVLLCHHGIFTNRPIQI